MQKRIRKQINFDKENLIILENICINESTNKSDYINKLLAEHFKNIDKTVISNLINELNKNTDE